MRKIFISFLLFGIISCASQRAFKTIKSVDYFCGTQAVTVDLSDTDEALLKLDNKVFRIQQTISASGARYADKDENVVFWSKGNEASLEIEKTIYPKCLEEN